MNTLATYAFPKIGHLSVKEIDTGLVLKVVEPISKAKTATALPFMRRVPLRTRLGLVSVGASAARVPSAHVKPITSLSLTGNQTIDEHKALAIIAASAELLRLSGAEGNDLFARELKAAVATVTDQIFLELITESVSPTASLGGLAINVLQDLNGAFGAINTDSRSALFIATTSAIVKQWSVKTTLDGAVAFPGMSPTGGVVVNVPVVVSDGVTAGQVVVFDAFQIAAAQGAIELDISRQADLQMNTTPDSPFTASTVLTSM